MTPFSDRKISSATRTGLKSESTKISKLCSTRSKMVFISSIANFCPTQFLEPALNGTNANGLKLSAFRSNRSGMNDSGFSQIDSLLPITTAAISKLVPFGMNFPSVSEINEISTLCDSSAFCNTHLSPRLLALLLRTTEQMERFAATLLSLVPSSASRSRLFG